MANALAVADRSRLDARVRDLIDPSTFGRTDRELEKSGIAKRRRDEIAEWRRRARAGEPPPLARWGATRHPYIEPRRRACFVPPPRWMGLRRQMFDFLRGKPSARRAEPHAAHWKKLRKALDAKARKTRQELEQRERELRQGGSAGEEAVSPRHLEELAHQIEALGDLPRWRVQWLIALLDQALTEEALMGDVEALNRRRAGLEFEVYEFELAHPAGRWELVDEHARVIHARGRTDLGARYYSMVTLTRLGLGVDVSSQVTADLLRWFGIEGLENTHPSLAIKQWWWTLDGPLRG